MVVGQALIVAISLYLSAVTALGYRKWRRGIAPNAPETPPRFGLLVCARDEQDVIARIVGDLLTQDYPAELRTVVVVAHNCTDSTASLAARAGAMVVPLQTAAPGKAQAIQAGLAGLGVGYDLVGVFDADARVTPDLLRAVASHSKDEACLQAEALPIADSDWLAEGYGFGRKARNLFWWRPREALGLSTTITGCGWFIRPDLLHRYSSGQWTMTEDLELTARMVADGYKVRYVSEAKVALGEPRELSASMRQRSRWVRGHINVVKGRWPGLFRRAIRGDRRAIDMAIYLIVPTRLLTRLAVTLAAVFAMVSAPFALPGALVAAAVAGEWLIPAYIGWKERLVKLSTGSLNVALRHSMLSLLWFPIGIYALATARIRHWAPSARNVERDASNVT
jgi:cellulose synthase/poly-beta-1,6-N-acetylglucosamine synthase-like glycosyltransferase